MAAPSSKPTPQLTADLSSVAASPSPALTLQRQLAQRAVTANSAHIDKWSTRRSVALIVSTSAALWMAILMAGAEASKMIA